MKYIDFITNIRFRFIKPHTWLLPIGFDRFTQWLKVDTLLEIVNTKLPWREREITSVLSNICTTPKMSTFAIGAMINEGVSQMPENSVFVNVGVWHGFTFLSGIANNEQKMCVGIDNFSEYGGPRKKFLKRFGEYKGANHYFYEMDYQEYFSHVHTGCIGFYIYDGNHCYDHQLRGLKVAEPFLSEGSIILIDDANYAQVRRATEDFIGNSHSDYKIILDRPTFCNCHPTFWNGIFVLQKIN